ncbi:MAG: ABC transporter substrate-binding protein, partial [Nocardioidaceae bacterium]
MRLKKTAMVMASAALLAVAACGGGGSGEGHGANPQDISEAGSAGTGRNPDATAPAEPVDGARKGGTLTVLSYTAPSTFDPTRAYYVDAGSILSNLVTRALTQYRYDPESKAMVLVPDMATDLGTPNEDFTEWKFTLRDGLKYENGTPVEAEDVAYAIRRSFATKELPDGPTYNKTFFLDGDTYKGPYKDGDDYKGVEVDGDTITIKMRRPFADMPYLASFPQYTAIPKSADKDPNAYGKHPMATGPYKFADYKSGSRLTLVKNDQWDPETDTTR